MARMARSTRPQADSMCDNCRGHGGRNNTLCLCQTLQLPVRTFQPRFVAAGLLPELSNLWHLSRVPHTARYDRLNWVAREFVKMHPEYSTTAVYKDLSAMLEFGGL